MEVHPDLASFLAPYPDQIQQLALDIRKFIVNYAPSANELIWDNYNALAIAYSKSDKLKDAFCHISVYGKHVNLGFNRGAELTPNALTLNGKGKLIRHVTFKSFDHLPQEEVSGYLNQAIRLADELNPVISEGSSNPSSMVMSVSEKKIRPS